MCHQGAAQEGSWHGPSFPTSLCEKGYDENWSVFVCMFTFNLVAGFPLTRCFHMIYNCHSFLPFPSGSIGSFTFTYSIVCVHIIPELSWCPLCKHNPFPASLLLKWLTALNVWDQMMLSKLQEKTKDCKRHHAEEMMRVWFIWRHGIIIWTSFILFIIFMFLSSVPRGIVLFVCVYGLASDLLKAEMI